MSYAISSIHASFFEVLISKLTKGKKYDIPFGPFKGQKGRVLNVSKNKLRFELPSLGFFVTLTKAAA